MTSGVIRHEQRRSCLRPSVSQFCVVGFAHGELYGAQNLIIPDDSTDWVEWAEGLKAIDVFTNEGIPGPRGFDDWQVWAQELVNAVNPGSN